LRRDASALETDAHVHVALALTVRHTREGKTLLLAQRSEVMPQLQRFDEAVIDALHDAPPLLQQQQFVPHTLTALMPRSATPRSRASAWKALLEQPDAPHPSSIVAAAASHRLPAAYSRA
jgi:hypothetical protein